MIRQVLDRKHSGSGEREKQLMGERESTFDTRALSKLTEVNDSADFIMPRSSEVSTADGRDVVSWWRDRRWLLYCDDAVRGRAIVRAEVATQRRSRLAYRVLTGLPRKALTAAPFLRPSPSATEENLLNRI